MSRLWCASIALAVMVPAISVADMPRATISNIVQYNTIAPLPADHGFAGMYAGVSNGALIAAGGANFPDAPFWESGAQVWHDAIFVLEGIDGTWRRAEQNLVRPMAYGVSVSHRQGVICIGGGDAQRFYADVFALRWRNDRVEIQTLPSLPAPRGRMCGALIGDVIYIAGGAESPGATRASHSFWALDLSAKPQEQRWVELEPWPGSERYGAVAAVLDGSFYLVGGVRLEAEDNGAPRRVTPYLRDGYCYTPGARKDGSSGTWKRIADLPRAAVSAPSPAPTIDLLHFLVLGGATEELENFTNASNGPGDAPEAMAYHSASNQWIKFPSMSAQHAPISAPTVQWQRRWLVVSGEWQSSGHMPVVATIECTASFGWINWLVLTLYLIAMVVMGIYLSKREKGTADFFLAGRRIPWWAAGLSIYGTQLSGITFMALPEEAFLRNWTPAIGTFLLLAIVPIIVYCYLPFFRRLNVTTAYEYLEKRFNVSLRLFGSASFLLFQFGRMGIVLFIPAVAVAAVSGIDVYLCIVVMGGVAIAYTVMGGIEAVIWTDVIQVIILLGGALLCLGVIISGMDGGMSTVMSIAWKADKLKMFDWDWHYTGQGVWIMVVGCFFLNLTPYTSDQTVVQRYLTTKDEAAARQSLWTNALLALPAIPIFFGLGTALYVFYAVSPGQITSDNSSEILPWFIVHNLPVGIAGLVMAGLFAACMSSLDSSMNSMATVYIIDFHRRFRSQTDDHACLGLARWLTLLFGIVGVGTAMLLATMEVQSLFVFFQVVLGVLGGSVTGVFVLGVFTRRANSISTLIGAVAGTIAPLVVLFTTNVSGYLYGAIGVCTCVLVGYGFSLLLPSPRQALAGLTIYTMAPFQPTEQPGGENVITPSKVVR